MIEIKESLECDVLVVGGGTSGMMAAISAAEAGANVIIAEKANTMRSGAGATGNDHFQCYIPEVHGTFEEFMKLYLHDRPGMGMCKDMDMGIAFAKESYDMVLRWQSWGLNMKPHGYWEMTGHTLPWITGTHLKYEGVNQKIIFTKEALKRGVKILNHHPLSELITDNGRVVGAVVLDLTENPARLQVIKANSVILCTARTIRLTGNDRLAWKGYHINDGVGTTAAYKAGAVISNAGVTGFRSNGAIGVGRFSNTEHGTRSWVGTYTDLYGKPYAPFGETTTYDVLNPEEPGEPHEITWPTWKTGDYTQYLPENKMSKAYAEGKTVFMNFSYNTEEDTDYMKWALVHEGTSGILQQLETEGFDFKTQMLEFAKASLSGGGKAGGPDVINDKWETSLPGLYAAGEGIGNHMPGLSPAAVGGWIAGRNAAQYSKDKNFVNVENNETVANVAKRMSRYMENEDSIASPSWEEFEAAIVQILWIYCANGVVSNELFDVALHHLHRIMDKLPLMKAANSHELMQCMAVESLAQNAEIAILVGRERRESRGKYKHADYPDSNKSYNGKYFTIQLVDGKAVVGLRPHRKEAK